MTTPISQSPAIQLSKTNLSGTGPFVAGQTVTYEFTVTNTGDAPWDIIEGQDHYYRSLRMGELFQERLERHLVSQDFRQKIVDGIVNGAFPPGMKLPSSRKLAQQLVAQGLHLITPIRRNMKNRLLPLFDKLLLRQRAIIETINDQLKNISQIEHSRHRSVANFLVNLLSGLIAYCLRPKKPALNLRPSDLSLLAVIPN